jgi:MFS family permease
LRCAVRPLPGDAPHLDAVRRDYRLLLSARVLRGFAFGFATVLIGIQLEHRGLNPKTLGVALAIGVLAASLYGLPLAGLSARVGRRPVLAATGLLMAVTGADLALATQPDLGPFLALEQAMLTESVPAGRRNRAFGRYSLTGGLALSAGGLAAGIGTTPTRVQALFLLFAVIGLVTAVIALFLSPGVESPTRGPVLSRTTIRPLALLAGLFAVDSLGGGLVLQAVIAYWLHIRFGAGTEVIGPALAALALVQSGSYEVASRLADRIGLVRTMVFTHLPSNVLLMLVAFSPNFTVALVLLILRFSISQMDVPARQAYVASIVPPAERAGALAFTGTVRGFAQAVGPAISGLAIQSAAFGLPFLLGGALKIAYDLGLYAAFVRRPAEHEVIGSGKEPS